MSLGVCLFFTIILIQFFNGTNLRQGKTFRDSSMASKKRTHEKISIIINKYNLRMSHHNKISLFKKYIYIYKSLQNGHNLKYKKENLHT